MILSNEAAIRAGYANLASYRHTVRVQALHFAKQDAARNQAAHMMARRNQQSSVGAIFSVPAQPRLGAE